MNKILQIDFPFDGPFGEEMTDALADLAHSITQEPGFIWKIWTESESLGEGGGIYLFESEDAAQAYLLKHTERLKKLGVPSVRGRIYDINAGLSKITKSPQSRNNSFLNKTFPFPCSVNSRNLAPDRARYMADKLLKHVRPCRVSTGRARGAYST